MRLNRYSSWRIDRQSLGLAKEADLESNSNTSCVNAQRSWPQRHAAEVKQAVQEPDSHSDALFGRQT